MKNYLMILLITLTAFQLNAADSVRTDEIIVSASRIPKVYSDVSRIVNIIDTTMIKHTPVSCVDEVLNILPSVDVRSRGPLGIQSDLSIRGGSFDQALVMINGIPLNDPQTGHHSMNLPITLSEITGIEVLEGPGSRIFGPNAFSGAVNILSGNKLEKRASLNLSGGENGFYDMGLAASWYKDIGDNIYWGSYASASLKKSDGYIDNTDFRQKDFFFRSTLKKGSNEINGQFGYMDKGFGANSFYTADYPEQYEKLSTFFASIDARADVFGLTVLPAFYWRRNNDKFELFRNDAPKWYSGHNYHQTDIIGANVRSDFNWLFGTSSLGMEYRYEHVYSNVLGESLSEPVKVSGEENAYYTKAADRLNFSVFLEHLIIISDWTITGGMNMNIDSEFENSFCSGLELSYKLNKYSSLFAGVNQSVRLPTFTDLYYNGPTNIGNPDLEPEKAFAGELGWKIAKNIYSLESSLYYRKGDNIIDWVREFDSVKWQTKNITKLNTYGFRASLSIRPDWILGESFPVSSVTVGYNKLYRDKESEELYSKYEMNYLKDKLVISVEHDLIFNIGVHWVLNYRKRAGKYFDPFSNEVREFDNTFLCGLKVRRDFGFFSIFLQADNLFNSSYRDIDIIRAPGRWIIGGVKLNLL